MLAPGPRPGGVAVLDSLGSHKVGGAREAIAGAGGRLLCRPPYSPDVNPIELAFSKLKGRPRRAAGRTVEGLWPATGRLLDRFPPEECRNYFRHRGYAATPS